MKLRDKAPRPAVALGLFLGLAFSSCFSDARVIQISKETYPPHNEKIYLTALPLPQPTDFIYLDFIDIAGDINDSRDEILDRLARIGREIGADAIVDIKMNSTVVTGATRIERVTGKAVKLTGNARETLSILNGEWR